MGSNPAYSRFLDRARGVLMVVSGRLVTSWGMSSYEDLDAFKACHHLTLAVHRVSEKVEERDAELAGQLWAAALIASSRIARGAGFRQRRLIATCVDRTLGALTLIDYSTA